MTEVMRCQEKMAAEEEPANLAKAAEATHLEEEMAAQEERMVEQEERMVEQEEQMVEQEERMVEQGSIR
jgi:hypothetical protein